MCLSFGMSTKRTYTLHIHTAITREWFDQSDLDGSTFPEMADSTFHTVEAARGKTRSVLAGLYDPRVPLAAQPVAQIVDGFGRSEAWTEVPYVGIRNCDDITRDDIAKSAARGGEANRQSCDEYAAARFGQSVSL